MNTPTFITLPSGKRVNTSDIIQYAHHLTQKESVWIEIRSNVEGENEAMETMTPEQLDALLNPPQSPIVSPVLELRMPRKGDAVQFAYKGKVRHGVVTLVSVSQVHDEYSFVEISSAGDCFRYFPDSDREPYKIQ